jgi:battenin
MSLYEDNETIPSKDVVVDTTTPPLDIHDDIISSSHEKERDPEYNIRNVIGFFLLGLINNFNYVVFLSAAEHMIPTCTGCVLLADVVPALLVGLTAPFYMHWIPYNVRMVVIVTFSLISFQLVAWFDQVWIKTIGIAFGAVACGFGEITFLAMSSYYHKDVLVAWGSGTGLAGIFGSLSYLALTSWFKFSDFVSMMIISPFPLIMLLSGFVILTKNHAKKGICARSELKKDMKQTSIFSRIAKLPYLLKYMVPLFLVYYAEYMINQGVHPTLKFPNAPPVVPPSSQYAYYQFLYQIGVFLSRSSVAVFRVKNIWIPAFLQVGLFFFFFFDSLFRLTPNIIIPFGLTVFEGLLGGLTYVNAFYLISEEVEEEFKEFSMGITSVANTIGISLAGLSSVGIQPFLKANQRRFRF